MTNKIQLKTPEDVRRYVCKVLRTIQESGDEKVIENAGKISQLLGQWIKAYEVQELADIKKRLKTLEDKNALR
ncbi:MAG: hypothetical protein PHS80_02600 [Methanothrix sp.]|nr:hypothetical protein [Methanothrix sp.]